VAEDLIKRGILRDEEVSSKEMLVETEKK